MRLWSLHPKHLDAKGLVALWREGLLARKVLSGKTRGYVNHPQLERFKGLTDPVAAMDAYLLEVWKEAVRRGYRFERGKLGPMQKNLEPIRLTRGQLEYEWEWLGKKLKLRDMAAYGLWEKMCRPEPHPIFLVVGGPVEGWEKVA